MTGNDRITAMQALEFLRDYQKRVAFHYQKLFKKWQLLASRARKVNRLLMAKFFDLYPRGKQHRGALAVLGYELAGGKDKEDILKASIMIELMETSILIADDVIDLDERRRGVATIHKQWEAKIKDQSRRSVGTKIKNDEARHFGESMAQITSIIGFHLAPWVLLQTKFSDLIKTKALNFYNESLIETGWGEALDVASSWQKFKDKQNSAGLIHDYKTVHYSSVLPLKFGAILAGTEPGVWLSSLEKYAVALGRIFQIQDDIIGSFGNPKVTGKANDNDIKEGRWTMLMEILWARADREDKSIIKQILSGSKRTAIEVSKIKKLMEKYGAVAQAQKRAQNYLKEGLELIPKLTKGREAQETLENLLRFMLERKR
ncbi:hypothetical protein A2160_00690 [Candidatus Beckwithbacteria bacterium RBG_13_42_9]|uniref:Polyprenyl synthetase n=1 Tax=Candidatus Beckwithbacteria bacterium RBG_13_42_9 TaxID=1797457 RepID=A0A1F5E4U7_9BACT|nr:MAG: hypothetical protein A2160_00690 [Candidatus Beckwithbacteria bacterium RBG_13_42_9]